MAVLQRTLERLKFRAATPAEPAQPPEAAADVAKAAAELPESPGGAEPRVACSARFGR
ncbi:unnamed protein product [Effrenium voratum]|nr:unnamed protein product [Effrenium voratum]